MDSMSQSAPILAAMTRLSRGSVRAAARLLLRAGGPGAAVMLDSLPADGPHGAVLAERLRFGPPETWRGWRTGDGAVAVKLYGPAPLPAAIAAMNGFRHPGVAPLLGHGPGWIVWRWIAGKRAVPGMVSKVDMVGITEAVAALHRAGLAHGDLKPANIILAAHPVLIDWGEVCAGTPGWRPACDHGAVERDLYALDRLKAYFFADGSQ